jgi:hypothetical protein
MLKISVAAIAGGIGAVPVSTSIALIAVTIATAAFVAHLRAESGPRNSFIQ